MLLAAIALFVAVPTAPVKKVLVIGVDGCRPDALTKADTPYIESLIQNGCWAVGKADPLTVSGPCWSAILCGVWSRKHGVTDNSFTGANYREYPDFLTLVERHKPSLRTVAVTAWKPIIQNIVRGADYKGPKDGEGDEATALEAASQITDHDPDVVFVHFDAVDGAGHSYGYGPEVPQYIKSIEETDKNVGLLLAAVQSRKKILDEDWLVVLTSDHGGTGKGHGLAIPEHINIPFIVSGPSAADYFTVVPTQVDVAPTVFAHLGIAPDDSADWDGVPVGLKGSDGAALAAQRDRATVRFDPPGGFFVGGVEANFVVDGPFEVRFTTDGSLPTASSPVGTGLRVDSDSVVRARAFKLGRPAGPSSFALFQVQDRLLSPAVPDVQGAGLRFVVVAGEFSRLADVDFSVPLRQGVTARPSERSAGLEANYAIQFDGYVSAPRDGVYRFGLNSDDGSRLWIGGRMVVDHDGLHGPSMKTGLIALKAGWHKIRVAYFQASGGAVLSLAMGLDGDDMAEPASTSFGH